MSAAGAAPRMAFNGVWPTLLLRRRLPGFEQPTAGLAALIAERRGAPRHHQLQRAHGSRPLRLEARPLNARVVKMRKKKFPY